MSFLRTALNFCIGTFFWACLVFSGHVLFVGGFTDNTVNQLAVYPQLHYSKLNEYPSRTIETPFPPNSRFIQAANVFAPDAFWGQVKLQNIGATTAGGSAFLFGSLPDQHAAAIIRPTHKIAQMHVSEKKAWNTKKVEHFVCAFWAKKESLEVATAQENLVARQKSFDAPPDERDPPGKRPDDPRASPRLPAGDWRA